MISKELLDKVISGDEPATRVFLDRIIPLLRREAIVLLRRMYGLSSGAAGHEPMDLVQHALQELLSEQKKILTSWDPGKGRSVESYLLVFMRLRMADFLRKRSNRAIGHQELNFDILDPTHLETDLAAQEILAKLQILLRNELSEADYNLFVQHYIEGRSAEEICQFIGLPRNTVDTRLRRIRYIALKLVDEINSTTQKPS